MLAQIVTQQSMLDLINRSMRFDSHLFEAYPDQDGTTDMISNNSSLATLIAFNTSQLFGFTVKLLDLPAKAAHLLYDFHVILLHLVGDDGNCRAAQQIALSGAMTFWGFRTLGGPLRASRRHYETSQNGPIFVHAMANLRIIVNRHDSLREKIDYNYVCASDETISAAALARWL